MSWEVDQSLIEKIKEILPKNSSILELGSGAGSTQALCNDYRLHSIEEDEEYLNKYLPVIYYHANLKLHKPVAKFEEHKNIWYDITIVKEVLSVIDYDLLLVDGPSSQGSRSGLVKYWDLFKQNVPIIIDDLQREREWKVVHYLISRLNRQATIYPTPSGKAFAVILP